MCIHSTVSREQLPIRAYAYILPGDLFNTLYDADHLKIALASLNRARTLIQTVSRDYVRLIKYAGSLYQCKQLKVSALGRMVVSAGYVFTSRALR